jgi:hypothetical protein
MTPGFTPEQRRAIASYVRWVADTMGFRDWLFELEYDPPPNSNTMAMIQPVYGRKVATIWFQRNFAELEPEKARHAIIHELAHVLTDPITSVLENTGPKLLGSLVWPVLWEATKERSELATDHIADILAPHLALIDWTDKEETERVVWTDTPSQPAEPDPPDA